MKTTLLKGCAVPVTRKADKVLARYSFLNIMMATLGLGICHLFLLFNLANNFFSLKGKPDITVLRVLNICITFVVNSEPKTMKNWCYKGEIWL